jgi:hypothetical protein
VPAAAGTERHGPAETDGVRACLPSEDERRLMTILVAGVDEPLLSEQVRTAVVDAVCRCGCSSVRLRSDGPPIPPHRVTQLSGSGRDDLLHVQAFSSDPATERVYVELHVVNGRVQELEVFDSVGGESVAVVLAGITGLGEVDVN